MPRAIELLSPAKTADIGITAINCGADAVYIGAPRFGARAEAGNSLADIKRLVEHAHLFGAKVYATVNTIIYDDELEAVRQLISELYAIGVDALIVQDMAVLMMDIPPIALHASTQCDIRTPEKARFLAASGFSQLVVARELTTDEIRAIHDAVDVPIEAFVHGALCVSYSGRCHVSQALFGRSANRGCCAQVCRFAYDLIDGDGRMVATQKHLLSLRDLNRTARLAAMIEAGVSSFKIEGRLKDELYVANTTAAYRRLLDEVIAQSGGKLRRASAGHSAIGFEPSLTKIFNRGFTPYFFDERRPAKARMASLDTPKSIGEPIGQLTYCAGKHLRIATETQLHNGDGISYIDVATGEQKGFRINTIAADGLITLRDEVEIPLHTMMYRTYDIDFERNASVDSARRIVPIDLRLTDNGDSIALTAQCTVADGSDIIVTTAVHAIPQPALTNQSDRQRAVLLKLGNTIFSAQRITTLPELFIPASALTEARREVAELMTKRLSQAHRRPVATKRVVADYPEKSLTFADNVANRLAADFYRRRGVGHIEPAIESSQREITAADVLMTTRYCIRRELGACLRQEGGLRLKEPLTLRSRGNSLRLHYNCAKCEMYITSENNPKT